MKIEDYAEIVQCFRNLRPALAFRRSQSRVALDKPAKNGASLVLSSCFLPVTGLAFQIWSNSNSKFRKFYFKFPIFRISMNSQISKCPLHKLPAFLEIFNFLICENSNSDKLSSTVSTKMARFAEKLFSSFIEKSENTGKMLDAFYSNVEV